MTVMMRLMKMAMAPHAPCKTSLVFVRDWPFVKTGKKYARVPLPMSAAHANPFRTSTVHLVVVGEPSVVTEHVREIRRIHVFQPLAL